ncbi:hypothetical protein L596_013742 [Steinernema carpocapsae]|uniref:Uncharacterized protein n=1 Tax=Steinernema carpocapsae TaxID=34508 RepID=A0A4U5P129_STECR|nr:hypothetical protein L596_013742 [Steinernema carpocapsae]
MPRLVFVLLFVSSCFALSEAQNATIGFQNAISCAHTRCDIYHTCVMMVCQPPEICPPACNCQPCTPGTMCLNCRCPYCVLTVPNEIPETRR